MRLKDLHSCNRFQRESAFRESKGIRKRIGTYTKETCEVRIDHRVPKKNFTAIGVGGRSAATAEVVSVAESRIIMVKMITERSREKAGILNKYEMCDALGFSRATYYRMTSVMLIII